MKTSYALLFCLCFVASGHSSKDSHAIWGRSWRSSVIVPRSLASSFQTSRISRRVVPALDPPLHRRTTATYLGKRVFARGNQKNNQKNIGTHNAAEGSAEVTYHSEHPEYDAWKTAGTRDSILGSDLKLQRNKFPKEQAQQFITGVSGTNTGKYEKAPRQDFTYRYDYQPSDKNSGSSKQFHINTQYSHSRKGEQEKYAVVYRDEQQKSKEVYDKKIKDLTDQFSPNSRETSPEQARKLTEKLLNDASVSDSPRKSLKDNSHQYGSARKPEQADNKSSKSSNSKGSGSKYSQTPTSGGGKGTGSTHLQIHAGGSKGKSQSKGGKH